MMRLVLLLFLISPIILAENPIIWSLCSRKNHSQWIKHKPRKDHFNFVQAWVKSIYLNNKKCPSKDFKVVSNAYSPNNFELITRIDNSSGKHIGMGWKTAFHYDDDEEELFHSGYFYGKINNKNLLEGNNIAFVYPDFETALVGKFVDEVNNDEIKMISAKEAKIVAFKCQNGMVDLKIKSKSDSPIFKYDPPSLARISKNPTLQDPLERKNLYIKTGPFGDTLFAKRDISRGDLVAYLNGFWYEKDEINWSNMTISEQWDFHKNQIQYDEDYDINIPKPYWDIVNYRATLGHKVNHSFIKNNTKFGWAYSPRFGHCRSIVATRNIRKGEELWINYGYSDMNNAPQWYIDTYVKEFGRIPKRKNL